MSKQKTEPLASYRPQSKNANKHTQRGLSMLEKSIQEGGFIGAMTSAADGEIFDGSARLETVGHALPVDPIVIESDGTRPIIVKRTDIATADDPKAKRLALMANRTAQVDLEWDAEILKGLEEEIKIDDLFSVEELKDIFAGEEILSDADARKTLQERFIVPPFSIFDTRQGYWQNRKQAWVALGIKSEMGRGGELLKFSSLVLTKGI